MGDLKKGSQLDFHNVDDFIFTGSPNSSQCLVVMATAMQVCTELGIPIEPDRMVIKEFRCYEVKIESEKGWQSPGVEHRTPLA